MKRFTLERLGLFGTLFATSLAAQAIEKPVLPTRTLTSGEKYVLVNPANPTGYMARTGWDGALYFLGADDSNYADHQLQAVDNGDGTWSFTMTAEPTEEGAEAVVTYMGVPEGTANLNMISNLALWTVEKGTVDGYYWLKAGDGNNANTLGHYLHLNNGQQYFVLSYPGAGWYPDFPVKTDADGNQVEDPETGWLQMADSTSLNWGFLTVEDVAEQMPLYAARTEVYNSITNYEETYLIIDEYAAGFKAGADAVEAIYNNAAFEIAWKDSVHAIINAKVALYEEIEKSLELNVDGNATLAAATEAAKAVFDASANAEELDAAKVTLVKAESTYSQGQGDLTSLGKNMSFEDLSAQGGNTTVGVADAPYGWTLIIGGDTCQTAAEIQTHGVANWCGVNADCAGETKDGNYGFGIWTAGFPNIEISQKIEGLENGTYEISAAMMVGANGYGSRRTTQRIFGNLNAAYFGAEEDYNLALLDGSEVASFAGLIEPVTDTEMYPISVRAYVYDGTLTFGFRTDGNVKAANRETSNQAGGDGWFKIDNFRIAKAEYMVEDALAVLSQYINLLDECQWGVEALPQATYDLLDASIQKYQNVNASSTREEIDATIAEAVALLKQVTPEVDAYRALNDAINAALANLEEYNMMPGATAFEAVITEIQGDFYEGVYDIAGTVAAIAELEAAFEACKKSKIEVGQDITNLLVNPSFENQAASQPGGDTGGVADAPKGWTLILNGDTCRTIAEIQAHDVTGWCAINGGDAIEVTDENGNVIYKQPTDGDKLWGIWTSNMPEVELSQTLTGLPKGTYTLTADVMVQNNWAGDNITTQRIFGNKFIQMFSYDGNYAANMPADALWGVEADMNIPDDEYDFVTYARYTCESGDATTNLLRPMSVKFVVDESGIATIGFRTNGVNPDGLTFAEGGRNGQGWFKVDNFRLTYDSEVVPEKLAQGIDTEVVDADVVSRQYFTIGGVQTDAAHKGFIIVKSTLSDGSVKVSKMLVK